MVNDDHMCRECGREFDDPEQVRRHQRKHGQTFEQYTLKWKHGGVRPCCVCGCGGQPAWNVAFKDYAKFVHGHHMTGHEVSTETRELIGSKTSITSKRFMDAHPEVANERAAIARAACRNEASDLKRSQAVRHFWSSSPLAPQRRKEASDRAIVLLKQNRIGPQATLQGVLDDEHVHGQGGADALVV